MILTTPVNGFVGLGSARRPRLRPLMPKVEAPGAVDAAAKDATRSAMKMIRTSCPARNTSCCRAAGHISNMDQLVMFTRALKEFSADFLADHLSDRAASSGRAHDAGEQADKPPVQAAAVSGFQAAPSPCFRVQISATPTESSARRGRRNWRGRRPSPRRSA